MIKVCYNIYESKKMYFIIQNDCVDLTNNNFSAIICTRKRDKCNLTRIISA